MPPAEPTTDELVWPEVDLEAFASRDPRETIDPRSYMEGTSPSEAFARTTGGTAAASGVTEEVSRLPAFGEGEDYVLTERLGSGGMGEIWLAQDVVLQRDVAVKRLQPGSRRRRHVRAIVGEARMLASLEHPAIPPVHGIFRDAAGWPVLVMKCVRGVTWSRLIADPFHAGWSRTPWADEPLLVRNVEVLLRVTEAVAFAHRHGVLHRDLKPDNVMVGELGEVYLLDWGIAIAREAVSVPSERLAGTPSYMAPEMFRAVADERTDVYLLGAVLHEVLTGEPPHRGRTMKEVAEGMSRGRARSWPTGVDPQLAATALEALAPSPEDRPASVSAWQRALRRWLGHRGATVLFRDLHERLEHAEQARRGGDLDTAARCFADARRTLEVVGAQVPDHPELDALRTEALSGGAEVALERGHLDEAAALLEGLDGAAPDLRARVEQGLAHARALHSEAVSLDPEVGRTTRLVYLVACVASMVGVAGAVARTGGTGSSYGAAVWLSGNAAVFSAMGMAVFWRRLWVHPYNRRITLLVVLASTAVFVDRFLMARLGAPLHQALVVDLLLASVVGGAAAIVIAPWMATLSAVALLGAVAAALAPDQAPWILGTTVTVSSLIVAGRMAWVARARAVPSDATADATLRTVTTGEAGSPS